MILPTKQKSVSVVSAVGISQDQQSQLTRLLTEKLKSEVTIDNIIDPLVLGGIKIIIDGRVFDYSLLKQLENLPTFYEEGEITSLGDGIATVSGLPDVMYNELLEFSHGINGLVFNLEKQQIGVIILGDYKKLIEGDKVHGTGKVLSIPVGENYFGRVINPLGNFLDGKQEVTLKKYMPIERIAPGVIMRKPVDTPIQTGIKAIDSIIPIGRGQRELIIGDRGTGKTAIALDTIINQKKESVICIYVAIGQKAVRIARIYEKLKEMDAADHTIIVSASASEPASLQYIAPYAGCAIAEYFMEKGKDVLIVYDDLTKHAWAYRQISLLLKRPSGREAYPGDIFYLHSKLLERACKLDKKYGGGSITALPIIETQAGDVSAYIPTNVISITDGQIYLEPDLFFAGIKPAINVGLSVSRVGGAAQIKAMKKVSGQLRLELAQYRELAAFTQFSTDLDPETKKKIERGSRISELFKQGQYIPMPIEQQIATIWAITQGYMDDIPLNLIKEFENQYLNFLMDDFPKILSDIKKAGLLTDDILKNLIKTIITFKKRFNLEFNLNVESSQETTNK